MPKLAATEYCTGCTACASSCPKGCIAMTPDENGFLFPMVTAETCVSCGLCESACPVLQPLKVAEGGPEAYAGYSKDESIRLASSSGGVFTEIARAVLKDGGAVFGAASNAQFDVVHICAESEADLAKLRGAKYAQSDLRGVFADVKRRLEHGQRVLFSGTPCQVAGLKAFLQKDYVNLLTVDFICHSVPAPMAWQEYVKFRACQDNGGELPADINLRSKATGWTNYQYSNLFTYPGGQTHAAKSGESLFMKLFVGGYINRDSCAICPFKGYRRVSDLTIGDFWGIWDIAPEMDDDKGTSVILVQSQQGAALLQSISSGLVLKSVTLEEASRQNSAMLKASPSHPKRADALEMIRAGRIGECAAWFLPVKPTALQRIRRFVHHVLRKLRGNA